jgi:thiamine pyrophosphokinase
VIAADGGAAHALALGLEIDLAIGDFDSGNPPPSARRVERHPADKDATDLELALRAALALEPRRILVVGGIEGRLDHLLGELLLLAADDLAGVEMDAVLGDALVHVVRGARTLTGAEGELISLFAIGGPADGIATEGLAYPLDGESLEPGSSRGISNVFAAAEARISVGRGVLLAVRP